MKHILSYGGGVNSSALFFHLRMDDKSVSEFNSAITFLNRLNIEFSMAAESAMALDAGQWFYTLLTILNNGGEGCLL